jgi:FKBP-type peptidyl-prolyl cis-trans isomerase
MIRSRAAVYYLWIYFTTWSAVEAFDVSNRMNHRYTPYSPTILHATRMKDTNDASIAAMMRTTPLFSSTLNCDDVSDRRNWFGRLGRMVGCIPILSSTVLYPTTTLALVKGNAPPPSNTKEKIRCTNVEECQEMAERREQLEREQQDAAVASTNANPIRITPRGTRYRDVTVVVDSKNAVVVGNSKDIVAVQEGDTVTMYYKVLKLGKRSYDGLSGEGTVVFSCGYGYEDDENAARIKSFTTRVGMAQNIVALNDGIIGMPLGTVRRIQVVPERGWRKPERRCDGGPGGSGSGGDLKTDYVVVPTATMVATETCFDTTKLPFPSQSYAEQRRMAQRFDQSLILEVEVIDIVKQP